VRGVLIDFAGTMFEQESEAEAFHALGVPPWLRPQLGLAFARSEQLVAGLGPLPDGLAERWPRRDLSATEHRAAYLDLFSLAGVPEELTEPFYERAISPEAWRPYPDVARALRELRALGLPIAVLSNIAWDVRPIFARDGLVELVDAFVLSFEHRLMKPDPGLFRLACDAIGVPPEATVMIGDSEASDGGCRTVGCRFVHVGSPRPDDALLQAVSHIAASA
jgi:putative hydrolase of the HAD superfamily